MLSPLSPAARADRLSEALSSIQDCGSPSIRRLSWQTDENSPLNVKASTKSPWKSPWHGRGIKRQAPADDAAAKRARATLAASPVLYPHATVHARRMSALFHEMEAEISQSASGVDEVSAYRAVLADLHASREEVPAEEEKEEEETAWWAQSTPKREQFRAERTRAAERGDELLAKVETNLQTAAETLNMTRSSDEWWTMPTPARQDTHKQRALAAERANEQLAQMEAQLATAEAVLSNSMNTSLNSSGLLDDVFSSDEEAEELDTAKPQTQARWTLATLPVQKSDTLATIASWARELSAELGEVVGKTRRKDAFWTALLQRLRATGLLA